MKSSVSINFIAELEDRREKAQVNRGTIMLRNYEEFLRLHEYYKGNLVKPIHAAKMLGVSRAMIFQLEKEGKVRGYRLTFTDEIWKTIPAHLKLLISRSDVYIWIPVEDIENYAKEKGKTLKRLKGHYINEFYG
jgi:DNA-binding XRE family transcriptional regulator